MKIEFHNKLDCDYNPPHIKDFVLLYEHEQTFSDENSRKIFRTTDYNTLVTTYKHNINFYYAFTISFRWD